MSHNQLRQPEQVPAQQFEHVSELGAQLYRFLRRTCYPFIQAASSIAGAEFPSTVPLAVNRMAVSNPNFSKSYCSLPTNAPNPRSCFLLSATASGPIYQDTVSIAGLTATGQAIGSATQSTLSDQGNEGIAGMAFESISQ